MCGLLLTVLKRPVLLCVGSIFWSHAVVYRSSHSTWVTAYQCLSDNHLNVILYNSCFFKHKRVYKLQFQSPFYEVTLLKSYVHLCSYDLDFFRSIQSISTLFHMNSCFFYEAEPKTPNCGQPKIVLASSMHFSACANKESFTNQCISIWWIDAYMTFYSSLIFS